MVTSRRKLLCEEYPIDCEANDIDYFFIRELDARFRTVVDVEREEILSFDGSGCVPPDEIHLFKRLLADNPNGIPSLKLIPLYEEHYKRQLNLQSWGFRNLSDLIFNSPTIFAIQNFDKNTAESFPDYPTDYILHDPDKFKAPIKFDKELKLNTFRLILEFNNRGERFPVRHFVEYYRSYYENPSFDLDHNLIKPLFEIMIMEFPIEIDGDLNQLYGDVAPGMLIEKDVSKDEPKFIDISLPRPVPTYMKSQEKESSSIKFVQHETHSNVELTPINPISTAQSTTPTSIGDTGYQGSTEVCDFAASPFGSPTRSKTYNMDDLWLGKQPSPENVTDVIEHFPTQLTPYQTEPAVTMNLGTGDSDNGVEKAPSIEFTYKQGADLKVIHHDRNVMARNGPGPFAGVRSQRALFRWKERAVERGDGQYLIDMCGRKDLPADTCLPGSVFVEHQFPYGTETLGPGNHLVRATIVAVASPKTVFMHTSVTDRTEFNHLCLDMNNFFNNIATDGDEYKVPEWFLYSSFPCAACVNPDAERFAREWERSKVVGVDGDIVIVESVDYAGQRRVKQSDLRLLPTRFILMPIQSMRVKMMAVEERGENEKLWNKAKLRVSFFSLPDYELDCAFYKRESASNGKASDYEVIAFDRNDPDIDICLNDVLVLEGYAKYSDESKSEYEAKRGASKLALSNAQRPKYEASSKMINRH